MSNLKITTESGSVYELDTVEKTMLRIPGEDAALLAFDGEGFRYDALVYPPAVNIPLLAAWTDPEGNQKLRTTTPVLSIEEIN